MVAGPSYAWLQYRTSEPGGGASSDVGDADSEGVGSSEGIADGEADSEAAGEVERVGWLEAEGEQAASTSTPEKRIRHQRDIRRGRVHPASPESRRPGVAV